MVPEKIFNGFLPYMGMAAIWFMWPRCSDYASIPPIHWGSIRILALIGPVASEEKSFEEFSLYESM